MDPISNCIFHPNMIHFCWSPIRKHCWTTFEKVCQYWIFWLWTPKLKGLYSLSFVDLLWFCGQMPAQHGRLDILTQNVIRSCHSKKNLPCTRHIVIKRVNSEKNLREKLGHTVILSDRTLKKMDPLQFYLPVFLGIHRNPKQNDFFNLCEGFLR